MSDPNTLRILSFDGGGERGYLSCRFFEKFVQQWGISPSDIAKNFDVICGTEIGGIIALSFALGKTLDDILPFFTTQALYIFSQSSLIPSYRPNSATKAALILTNTPFYQSSGPTADYYGYGLLVKTLQSQFGTNTLQNLKTNVLIPSYNADTQTYVLFSNTNYAEYIGQNELITNVALATAAAPVYFPPLLLNGNYYEDGGIYNNNPAAFGRVLAQSLKPTAKRTCILSIGTGSGEKGFDESGLEDSALLASALSLGTYPSFDTIAKIYGLFSVAMTGSQESISKLLSIESKYTNNQLNYYRFQPTLDAANLNVELDNTDADILAYYDSIATQVFNNDNDNITNFIGKLTA